MGTNFEGLSLMYRDDGMCEILLSRPDLLNRFDNLLQVELASALDQITETRPCVRSCSLDRQGVLRGRGLRVDAGRPR